ncbi:MAG: trypsin-like peptidase domain-containing protein [Planctomycetia bacterium]|nr:trypsin-like peptidase domain-containing protein [Planctomycetia bacterium]
MQITVACVDCRKRFLVDDKSLEKDLICPACGSAMKSTMPINTSKPSKSHVKPTADPFWDDLPAAGTVQVAGDTSAKKIMVWGGTAAGLILLLGIGWIVFGGKPKDDAPVVMKQIVPIKQPEQPPVAEVGSAPVFAPRSTAPPIEKEKPRVKMSVADLIQTAGNGVVHLTTFDAHGKPYDVGSGWIIARRHVDQWIEPEVTKEDKPPQGDLWLVATNYHVVAGASGVTIRLRDGTTYKARGLAAFDRNRDLALLALDDAPQKLTVLQTVANPTLRQGEEVLAIGHPSGFDFTTSTGIIGAIRGTKELPEDVTESMHAPDDQQWVQTTAAVVGGNGGGPLLAMTGEVIGIDTWSYNAGSNLAFASHVRHVVELNSAVIETEGKLTKVRVQPFSAAKPIEVPDRIGDKSNWLESDVHDGLARSAKRALAVDWRPTTKGDYFSLQAVATMLTLAAIHRYDMEEIKSIKESLGKRKWDFESEVKQIDRFALENLDEGQWGVFFFGKVRRINPATRRHLWVDLTGRGYVVAVTIPTNQPVPPLKVGDDIAVLGYRIGLAPDNSRLPRGVHNILAGLILPVALPPVPEDTVLQAAYDLAKYDRQEYGFESSARKFADVYERVTPLVGKAPVRWQRINLNSRGRQFDAVRFSVPPGLNGDLVWSFNSPEDAIDEWGVMPVGDFPMRVQGQKFTMRDMPAPALSREESQYLIVQCVTGGLLVPGEDYLLWFTFKNPQPRRIAIAVRVVPTGSFDAANQASLGQAVKDGAAFKPEEITKMLKAMKDKAGGATETKPN